eukprot:TRINITY_DN2832_c0_g1_i1.p1 TRINITY_DN2832_c0_g1~~TRINITY_DN2832_c0_g1_i1.p1  ORF type:complete len:391 (-),score=146.62 TRINITY_DN2832_c0_g1_i1:253-1425(-)
MSGGMSGYNMEHGLCEAVVRGYRFAFLKDLDYHHLCQSETLEDVKLNLEETDYDNFLEDHPSDIPLTPKIIKTAAIEKLRQEMEFLQTNSSEPMNTFLEYISYEYMIHNVMILLKSTMVGEVAGSDVVEDLHPLGKFSDSVMKSILSFENTPSGYEELYSAVLIDTPVGKYFERFLQQQKEREIVEGADDVRNILSEIPLAILENSIMKFYLEDFYAFCETVGGDTFKIMSNLLKARADSMIINVTLNSFGTPLNEPNMRTSDRKLLYPSIGYLYPEGIHEICRGAGVEDEEGLARVLSNYPDYKAIWTTCIEHGEKSIDDVFYERDVMMCELSFEGQFHCAMLYGFVRLREQEIRNMEWITECIVQGRKEEIEKYIPIFSDQSWWRNIK